MGKKKNKEIFKIRKLILIFALLAIIGIIALLVLLNNPVDNNLYYIYSEQINEEFDMPLNVSPLFTKYAGRVNQRSIYKSMHVFVDKQVEKYYLKFKKKNFEQAEIEKYYDSKSEELSKELGIESKEDFVSFINSLKNLKGNELILKEYTIIPDSIENITRATKFVISVDYENNERLMFELELKNSSSESKTPIKYSTTDDKYKDYNYERPDASDSDSNYNSPGKVF